MKIIRPRLYSERSLHFELVGVSQPSAMDELPLEIVIEGHSVSVKILAHESNWLAEESTHLKLTGVIVMQEKATEQFSCVMDLA